MPHECNTSWPEQKNAKEIKRGNAAKPCLPWNRVTICYNGISFRLLCHQWLASTFTRSSFFSGRSKVLGIPGGFAHQEGYKARSQNHKARSACTRWRLHLLCRCKLWVPASALWEQLGDLAVFYLSIEWIESKVSALDGTKTKGSFQIVSETSTNRIQHSHSQNRCHSIHWSALGATTFQCHNSSTINVLNAIRN